MYLEQILLTVVFCHYRPQRSCGQGNIFTPVCHSVHRGDGISQGTEADPPGPGTHPPWSRHTPPRPDTPPGPGTPPEQTPPGADTPPGTRFRHTVYEQLVRILLECILVNFNEFINTNVEKLQ